LIGLLEALPRVQKVFTMPFRELFKIWEELARHWTDRSRQRRAE